MNANDGVKINIKVKDTLFRYIFGEDKKAALSLYNAVNGSDYTNEDDLIFTTLQDVVYMKMKNDVSFLFGNELSLYEHQSTYNPNMPLRGFMYFADLYRQILDDEDIYGSKLIKIPAPRYVVFYNGIDKDCGDVTDLKLSDSFEINDKPEGFEWTARMININYGNNKELMKKCKKLEEYSIFIFKIREFHAIMDYRKAVDAAVDYCIENDILKDILLKHRAEVKDMLLTEYDEKKHIQNEKDLSLDEGIAKGRAEGLIEGKEENKKEMIITMLSNGAEPEKLAVFLDTSVEEILKYK